MIKISIYQNNKKILGGVSNIEEDKVKEIIDSERPITTTINSTSTDSEVPSAKSVYTRTRGISIDESNINTYGTEILKYAVGKWIISKVTIAEQYSDLPIKTAGIMDIESINDKANPWDSSYSYRLYTFKTYNRGTYIRKLGSSNIAGTITIDTGWQKVCTTTVEDVATTKLTWSDETYFKSDAIATTGNYFQVRNGVCYVNIDLECVVPKTGGYALPIILPKPATGYVHASISSLSNSSVEHSTITIAIANNNNSVDAVVYGGITNNRYLGTFSYPVAEN